MGAFKLNIYRGTAQKSPTTIGPTIQHSLCHNSPIIIFEQTNCYKILPCPCNIKDAKLPLPIPNTKFSTKSYCYLLLLFTTQFRAHTDKAVFQSLFHHIYPAPDLSLILCAHTAPKLNSIVGNIMISLSSGVSAESNSLMTLNQSTESESGPSNEHSENTTSKYIQLKYERQVITEEHLLPTLHVNDYRLP